MGNGTSTASSRKHSSSRRTQAHRQHGYSFLQQLLRACARSNTSWSTSQLIQTLSGLCGGRSCMSLRGTTVGSINVTTSASATGMYEPNQFVMNCGIADPTAGPIRFSSPVAPTSTTETQSHWSSDTPTQQQGLLWERVVMLSLSNKHQFTLTHRQGGNTSPPLPIIEK